MLLGFLPLAKNSHEEILCVFQGGILQRKGKRLGQNRIMFYETPPKCRNVIKLRKAGSHRDVGSSFFVTIIEIMLDK